MTICLAQVERRLTPSPPNSVFSPQTSYKDINPPQYSASWHHNPSKWVQLATPTDGARRHQLEDFMPGQVACRPPIFPTSQTEPPEELRWSVRWMAARSDGHREQLRREYWIALGQGETAARRFLATPPQAQDARVPAGASSIRFLSELPSQMEQWPRAAQRERAPLSRRVPDGDAEEAWP